MNLKIFNGQALLEGDKALLDSFRENIYEPAFPDPDEREPFDKIIERVLCPGDVQTFVVLGIEGNEVMGGIAADWYPGCRSLEIIYIAVAAEHCRKGLGRRILREGTRMICKALGDKLTYVFAEVENPFMSQHPTRNIDPVSRLRFFSKEGARRVPVSYIQPPLDNGLDYASNLFLICFPAFTAASLDSIPAEDLSAFLNAFYDGLKEFSSDNMTKFESEREKLIKQVANAADFNNNVVLENII